MNNKTHTTAKVASYSWIAIFKGKEDTVLAPYAPKSASSSIATPKPESRHLGSKRLAANLGATTTGS
jgi:hypothetical protein